MLGSDKKFKFYIFFIFILLQISTTIFANITSNESLEKNSEISSDANQIHKAVINSDFEALDLLFISKEIDRSKDISDIGNILHIAAYYNNLKTLQYLLTKYFDEVYSLIDAKNKKGQTPLMLAAYLGNGHVMAFLISKGANINAKDNDGKRAIHWAAIGKQNLSIELLAYLKANLNAIDNNNLRAVDLLRENSDDESKKIIDLLNKLTFQNEKLKKAPPLYTYSPLENLVLEGGGAKGIAYVGAIKTLEKLDALKDLKRVAGTSAGAITATFISLGYTSDEMLNILSQTDLTDFLDYYISEKKIINLYENTSFSQMLKSFADDFYQIFKNPISIFEKTIDFFKNIFDATSLCEGEDFRKWIESKIYEKTNIHFLTFKELKHLQETNDKIKHLHVFTTMVEPTLDIIQISSEDEKFDDVIISDAVRASMSIPGVFKPHNLYVKNAENKRVLKEDLGLFIDGGVLDNFPIAAFDSLKYQRASVDENKDFVVLNKRTLGLSLYNPENNKQIPNEVSNIYDLGNTLVELYFNSEELFHKLEPYDEFRVIKINDEGVSTLEFKLSDEIKKSLELSGEEATQKFFDDQEKRLKEMDLIIDPNTVDILTLKN